MENYKKIKKLGEIFLEFGLIDKEILHKILKRQFSTEELIGQLLIKEGMINYDDLAKALSVQYRMPYFDLSNYPPPRELLAVSSTELLNKYNFIPLKKLPHKTIILIADPNNREMIAEITKFYNGNVEFFVGNSEKIAELRRNFLSEIGELEKKEIEPVISENLTFISKFLKSGSLKAVVDEISKKDDHIKTANSKDPEKNIAKNNSIPSNPIKSDSSISIVVEKDSIKDFLERIKKNFSHILVSIPGGEKISGRVIDIDNNFLLLKTSVSNRLIRLSSIGYIEEKSTYKEVKS